MDARIGDYELLALLGAGGMAKVYRARHVLLETEHAIKVLDPELRAYPDIRQRFLDEAKIQAKHLDHPNIVKVTNVVATHEHAALVMELIDGSSLESRIAELVARPDDIRAIMYGVLEGVGHAHRAGIIHRDLKPANVLLANKDGRVTPKVSDFGIAKLSAALAGQAKASTHADVRMGTLLYMSPEQIRRARDVTPRSDVFSLGAMLYEMATGAFAFHGDSDYDVMDSIVNGRFVPPEVRNPAIDPGLATVIRTALDPDPARRYASCADMAAGLRAGRASAPPPTVATFGAGMSTLPDGAVQRRSSPGVTSDSVPATRVSEVASRKGHGLAVALVVGGVALGGVALFLTMRGHGAHEGATATATADAAPRVAVADATSPDATAVAALVVDAGAVAEVAEVAIDAAIVDAAAIGEPPEVVADTRKIDAGSRRKPVDAAAPTALPIDAGAATTEVATVTEPPAAPHACVGLWSSAGVIVTVRKDSGTCGKIDFVERQGGKQSICSGVLRGCSGSGGALSASFDCNWSEKQNTGLTAQFTFECTGDAMVADVAFSHPAVRHDRWKLSK